MVSWWLESQEKRLEMTLQYTHAEAVLVGGDSHRLEDGVGDGWLLAPISHS